MVIKATLQEENYKSGNIKAIRVEGTSMLPLFKAGEVVFINSEFRIQNSELAKGDCVVYNFDGKKLLHRIIKIQKNGAWISDDAGIIEPHFIQWANIKGKVISKNPFTSGLTGLIYCKIKKLLSKYKSPSVPLY